MKIPVLPDAALDDARLLRRIARRDHEAFTQLYERYADLLYSTALRVLNNSVEAGEVLQQVFVQIWDESARYDPTQGKPFNWALTMTRQHAIGRLRALQRRYAFFAEITGENEIESGEIPAATVDVFSPDQVATVRATLATLPYEQRQAIELAFLGGMTQHEIAVTLVQPVATVAGRVRRGMLKLRESLRELL